MSQVLLGTSKFSGRDVGIPVRDNGCTILGAIARYGKSIVAKTIYSQIVDYKKVIIFDYAGEHSESQWINFFGDRLRTCLVNVKEINLSSFGFFVSDFDKQSDWLSLGVPDVSARLCATMSGWVNAHNNEPKKFLELLDDLPVKDFGVPSFNEKWSLTGEQCLKRAISDSTLKSLSGRLHMLLTRDFFVSLDNDKVRPDFRRLVLENDVVLINLDLADANVDLAVARAVVGKILEQLFSPSFLLQVHPLVVVEEADKLCADDGSGFDYSSLFWLKEGVRKLQKFNLELIFIVQDFTQISRSIVDNARVCILGQMSGINNRWFESTKRLGWLPEGNYREFLLVLDGRSVDVFVPMVSPVQFAGFNVGAYG